MIELPRLSIVGYADRLSVAPGETIAFKVSEESEHTDYEACLFRMHSLDDHAGGCGLIEEEHPTEFAGRYGAQRQTIETGSYVRFDAARQPPFLHAFSVQAYIWPTRPDCGRQTILSCWSAEGDNSGFSLDIDDQGMLELVLAIQDGKTDAAIRLSSGQRLLSREWYFAAASFDPHAGTASILQRPLRPYPGLSEPRRATSAVAGGCGWKGLALHIAARASSEGTGKVTNHFNGKIDRPRLLNRAVGDAEHEAMAGADPPAHLMHAAIGCWDFALKSHSTEVVDLSGALRHGELVNLPARAMVGFNWRGEENDFRRAPHLYGAIHFHDDDLYDAGWQTSFRWKVPSGTPSGCYAVKLSNGDVPGYIVFFVRPPRAGGPKRPAIAFLASTAHFLAYANYRLTDRDAGSEASRGRLWQFGPEDALLHERPQFGSSTYDMHSDGSAVCYSSGLRPVLNMRPNSRLSSLAGDGYVLAFLRHLGLDYDVITDEDLDREGRRLLEPYSVVVTGGHPEYVTKRMWDGLEGYLHAGGNLMYLGGNGFYWRTAFHEELPGVVEVRRAEDGTRAWIAEPGEYYMSFTGEYGGLWRRNGRAPNTLVGVGFTAQGFDTAAPYVRSHGSRDPRAAFIFDGVETEIIGDYGVGYGGAAGQEIDRFDPALGSPPHALVLASSAGLHTDNMLLAKEELCSSTLDIGGTEEDRVRADMVFFETGHGGAVFSTGSISWVSALPWANFDNDVAQITRNVVERMRDGRPFPYPAVPDQR